MTGDRPGASDSRVHHASARGQRGLRSASRTAPTNGDWKDAARELLGLERLERREYEDAFRTWSMEEDRDMLRRHLTDERRHEQMLHEVTTRIQDPDASPKVIGPAPMDEAGPLQPSLPARAAPKPPPSG